MPGLSSGHPAAFELDVFWGLGNVGRLNVGQATHLSGTTTLTPDVFIMGAARRVAGAIGWMPLAIRPVEIANNESILLWSARLFSNVEGGV